MRCAAHGEVGALNGKAPWRASNLMIRLLAVGERDALAAVLARENLPRDGLDDASGLFWRLDSMQDVPLGYGGIELHGDDALLRSVVNLPPARQRDRHRAGDRSGHRGLPYDLRAGGGGRFVRAPGLWRVRAWPGASVHRRARAGRRGRDDQAPRALTRIRENAKAKKIEAPNRMVRGFKFVVRCSY